MQLMFYNARGHDRELTPKQLPRIRITAESLLWINVTPEELAKLTLPKAVAEPLAQCPPEPDLVRVHAKCYSLQLPVLSGHGDSAPLSLGIVVGPEWLVSIGEGTAIDFADLIASDVGETMKGRISGSTLAAALIADHFTRIHGRIGTINREIDRIEERILLGEERRNTLQVMAVLRRQVSRLRNLVGAYRGLVTSLTRPDFLPVIDQEDRDHFTHLLSGFERLEDEVARLREGVVESFELYATRVAQDTNRLLRTLTFFTIGIGLIGALAGIFGMNFKAAIFEKGDQGFYLATIIMAVIMASTGAVAIFTYRRP